MDVAKVTFKTHVSQVKDVTKIFLFLCIFLGENLFLRKEKTYFLENSEISASKFPVFLFPKHCCVFFPDWLLTHAMLSAQTLK